MPQHFSLPTTFTAMPLCSNTAVEVFRQVRLVAIAVAGRRTTRPCRASSAGRLDLGASCRRACAHACCRCSNGTSGSAPSRSHAERGLEQLAAGLRAVHRVHDFGDHRDAGDAAEAARVATAACRGTLCSPLRCCTCFRAQHQVREVDVPGMRRHVRTLGHEAHVTEVTVIDHVPVDLLVDAIDLERRSRVDRVEQGRE